MGKSKGRGKNKARSMKSSGEDDIGSNGHAASASSPAPSRQPSSSADPVPAPAGARKNAAEPSTMCGREEAHTSSFEDASAHGSLRRMPKAKRDSVISSISTDRQDSVRVPAKAAPQPGWSVQVGRWLRPWWPCRLVRWLYHFGVALTRINWNDQQRLADAVLAGGLVALFVFGIYIVLEFLLVALPSVAAQSLEGTWSIVDAAVCLTSNALGLAMGPRRLSSSYLLLGNASANGRELVEMSAGVSGTTITPTLSGTRPVVARLPSRPTTSVTHVKIAGGSMPPLSSSSPATSTVGYPIRLLGVLEGRLPKAYPVRVLMLLFLYQLAVQAHKRWSLCPRHPSARLDWQQSLSLHGLTSRRQRHTGQAWRWEAAQSRMCAAQGMESGHHGLLYADWPNAYHGYDEGWGEARARLAVA